MESKRLQSKYYSALKISLIYLVVSSIYIIFSDKIILNFIGSSAPATLLNTVQSYKGLAFVLITSAIIFGLIQRENNSKRKYILELKSQKKKLEDNKTKTQTLFESMTQGVTYQNAQGEITDANPAAQRILGLSLDQMQGKTSMDPGWKSIHEDGSDFPGETHASMVALQTGKEVRNVIMGVFNTNVNEYRWIKIDATPQFRDGESKPYQVFTTFNDITVERRVQKSLDELFAKYQNIIHTANIAIAELNKEGNYTYVNPAWEEMFGFSSSEALGKNTGLIIPEDETDHSLFNKLEKGQVTDYHQERKFKTKNGNMIWCDLYVASNHDQKGYLTSIVEVMTDISGKKESEQKIREKEQMVSEALSRVERSENLLNETGKLAKVGGWELDLETMTPYFSEETYRIYELPVGTPPKVEDGIHFYAPEARPIIQKAVAEAIENHAPYVLEVPLITANGKNIWVKTYGQVEVKEGKAVRLYGAIQDITKQKLTEERIRLSESIMTASQKIAKIGGWQWDVISNKMFWTEETYQIHDFEKNQFEMGSEEHIKKSLECYTPNDREMIAKAFDKCIKTGEKYEFIVPFKTAKGRDLWVRTVGEAVFENNKVIKVTGLVHDITEFKRAQDELSLSEAHFRSLMDNVQGFVLYRLHRDISKNETLVLLVSPGITEMLGVSAPTNLNDWFKNIHPEDADRVKEANLISVENAKPFDQVMRICYPDKHNYRWIQTISYPVHSPNDNSIYFNGIIIDITQRKWAEEKLKESEEKYKDLVENSHDLIWTVDEVGKITFLNRASKHIYGYEPEELIGKSFFDFVPKAQIEKDTVIFKEAIAKGKDVINYESQFTHKDGRTVHLLANARILHDDSGIFLGTTGSSKDVTEQKHREEELKSSEQRFRTIVEGAPDPIFIQTNNCFAYVNNHAVKLFGANDEKELLGKPVLSYFHPDFHKSALERIKRLNIDKMKVQEPFEQILIQLNGNEIWVETKGQPIFYNGEHGGLVFVRDVSARKLAEKELRESKTLLENLNNNLPGAVIQYKLNPDGSDALVFVSEGAIDIWGIKPEEALKNNQSIWEQIDDKYIGEVKKSIEISYQNLSPWKIEFKNNLPDGSVKWIEGIGMPRKLDDGAVIWDSIMLDVTSRKEAEDTMKKYKNSLQDLTTEMMLVEEKQRKEIAANIHDHLSQSLVISKMKLGDLLKEMETTQKQKKVGIVIRHITEALENSRKITYDLSPPVLYELGLIEAIYWLTEKIEDENGIQIQFETELTELKLSESKLILVYRVIQEILNNTIKHAQAKNIHINFIKHERGVQISIKDDGKGFVKDKSPGIDKKNTGFGLFAVKERIENLKGSFTLNSSIGFGTEAKIFIPLKPNKAL